MVEPTPTTEVWFRNPRNYMTEVVEAGARNVAWDWGTLVKYKIDPERFGSLHFGAGQEWRGLVIANEAAIEVGPDRGFDNPLGVYPVWSYLEDVEVLSMLMSTPVSERPELVENNGLPTIQRPVSGQRHVVVICDLPPAHTNVARSFLRDLQELQASHPNCILHIHGLYAWKVLFGLGFKSIDYEARTEGSQGKVVLPNGKVLKEDRASLYMQWVRLMGMRPSDLKDPYKRCIFNIRSAMWAGQNYLRAVKFKTTGIDNPDTENPTALMEIQQVKHYANGLVGKEGDKFLCNTCSLATKCKFFREGSVCTLPQSETHDLARMFSSRDSEMIVDALGTLVKANTRRLEMGLEGEQEEGELNPEVGKLMDQVFSQGVKLVKLVDPARFQAGKTQVTITGAQQVTVANPNQMVAEVVRTLEAQGFQRHEITKEMIAGVLSSMANGGMPALEAAVEGEVIESGS